MDFILDNLLTLITFSPLLAAVVVSLLPSERPRLIKWAALGLSLIPLALSLVLWFNFESGGGFQFEEQYDWFPQIGASYHVGVDGISVPMVLLTCFLTPLALIISFGGADIYHAQSTSLPDGIQASLEAQGSISQKFAHLQIGKPCSQLGKAVRE